jgi:small-conductance mechanosensitive channel
MQDFHRILDMLHQPDAWGNSLFHWLIVAGVVLGIFLALRLLKAVLAHRADALVQKQKADWPLAVESLLRRTKSWFLLIVALFCGGYFFLSLPKDMMEILLSVAVIALLIQAALWIDGVLIFALSRYAEKNKDVDAASVTTLSALGFVGRLTIWTAAVLLAISNLGINVTTIIAGFGVGGIAVALAAQNILGDLFASASIVLDKPFVLGDYIVVDDKMGTIEYIGLKTTRLRSLTGEQLVFSNTDLLKSRIHNYKRMNERRVLFTIGASYDTPYEKVAALPSVLREIVESQQPTRFDRAHFARYGDSALIFEVVYYVLAADYTTFMNVQQAVNLAIFRRFAEEKIEFAFPTQTIYLRQ